MISDINAIHTEVLVNGKTYTSYCTEEFRKDEIPCSYMCKGEHLGKIRQITQIRAYNSASEEILQENNLWKTIQYGARHKLGHGRGLCEKCKKLGITAFSPVTPQKFFRREAPL